MVNKEKKLRTEIIISVIKKFRIIFPFILRYKFGNEKKNYKSTNISILNQLDHDVNQFPYPYLYP